MQTTEGLHKIPSCLFYQKANWDVDEKQHKDQFS